MQEIIINVDEQNNKTISIVENGILIENYIEKYDKKRMEGNIYLGRVENVLNGMQAAFVNIGQGKNTFIHLKDILPKIDITKNEKIDLSNEKISDYIKNGDEILVQVKRDKTEQKGPRVSTHISLVGRYIVLMPETEIITVSQKIQNKKEEERLKNILKNLLPKKYGAIVRTLAQNKTDEEIKADLEILLNRWEKIKNNSKNKKAPSNIENTNSVIKKILIDLMDGDISNIIVNSKELYNQINLFLKEYNNTKINVEFKNRKNILDIYDINNQIEKINNRKIWLDCGGFITIDKTEALVAIDVNSGKYIGKSGLEKTILKVNKEASIEIAKQLRLRDIGGIIVIDFIDMVNDESKKIVINELKENLKKDRSKTQILEFTKLNLLEMTRKHMFSNE